jgi:membrane-bound transcription factor site-1 protease
VTRNLLDWNGDHPFTNYRTLFVELRALGYFIDVLNRPWTAFDATR